jgi:hypothetical protein
MSKNELSLRVIASVNMEIDTGTFKKMFPHLTEETEAEKSKVGVNSTTSGPLPGEKMNTKRFDNYDPDVIDFICRCDNERQAHEIIDYVEKRCEIDRKYAQKLRTQLRGKGVRSFGPKREEGYYLRESTH